MKKCLIVIVIIMLCALMISCTGQDSQQEEYYNKGVEAYSSGDYTLAKNYFIRAEGYEDSDIYLDSINEVIENISSISSIQSKSEDDTTSIPVQTLTPAIESSSTSKSTTTPTTQPIKTATPTASPTGTPKSIPTNAPTNTPAPTAIPTKIPTPAPTPVLSPAAEQIAVLMEPVSVIIKTFDYNGDLFSSGSGFLINSSGYIATNYHVIEDGAIASIDITLSNGDKYPLNKVVNYDKERDIFIFSINYTNSKYAKLGDSSTIATGNTIYTYGSPLGITNTLTQGIISNRNVLVNDLNYIQISAPISPGSSGGTLVNQKGEVIGITVATLVDGQNMNLAIPINYLKEVISKGSMNINFQDMDRGSQLIEYTNGDIYFGEVKNGMPNGFGIMTFSDGVVYEGDFLNGYFSGFGTMTWPDGCKYVGNYLNDCRNGQGTFTWPDGEKYVGDWVDGNMEGQGTFTWPDGAAYTGAWINGLMHGYGIMTYSDGSIESGEWESGNFIG